MSDEHLTNRIKADTAKIKSEKVSKIVSKIRNKVVKVGQKVHKDFGKFSRAKTQAKKVLRSQQVSVDLNAIRRNTKVEPYRSIYFDEAYSEDRRKLFFNESF